MACQEKWTTWASKLNLNVPPIRINQKQAIDLLKIYLEHNDIRYKILPGGKIKIFCESTGSGKTVLILIVAIIICAQIKKPDGEQSRVLIVNPTRVIRDVNSGALDDALRYGIIPKEVYDEIKINTLDKSSSIGHVKNSDIIITTYQKLGASDGNLIKQLPNYIDIVLIDEGHHAYDDEEERDTIHQDILKNFNNCYRLLFTATPYKSMPRKEQETGLLRLSSLFNDFDTKFDVIHDFSYGDSWRAGYAKFPQLKGISLDKLSLIQTDVTGVTKEEIIQVEDIKDYKEILKKIKKSDYVQHPKAVELMLKTVIEFINKKNNDLSKRVHNAGLVVFRTKNEAIKAGELLKKITNKKFVVIYGGKPSLKEDMEKIQKDEFEIILGVDLLKEGFNYHNISVIGISRNIQSFGYFIQLLGRLARARKDKYGKDIPVIGSKKIIWDVGYLVYHEIQDQIKKYWDLFSKYDWKDITEEEIAEIEDEIEREISEGERIIEPSYHIKDLSLKEVSTDTFDETIGRPEDEASANMFLQVLRKKGKGIGLDISTIIEANDEVLALKIKGISPDEVIWEKDNGDYSMTIKPKTKKKSVDEIASENVTKANHFLQSQVGKISRRGGQLGDFIQARWSRVPGAISYAWGELYGYRLRGKSDGKTKYKITEEISQKLINHLPEEIKKYESLEYTNKNFIPVLIKCIKQLESWSNNKDDTKKSTKH